MGGWVNKWIYRRRWLFQYRVCAIKGYIYNTVHNIINEFISGASESDRGVGREKTPEADGINSIERYIGESGGEYKKGDRIYGKVSTENNKME